jgi:hypothetical protein
VKLKYWPIVKFRDIKESVLQAVQTQTGDKSSLENHNLLKDIKSDCDSENNNVNGPLPT